MFPNGWFLVYGNIKNNPEGFAEGIENNWTPAVPLKGLDLENINVEEVALTFWLSAAGWFNADVDTYDGNDADYGYRATVRPLMDSFEPDAKRSGFYTISVRVDGEEVGPNTPKETVELAFVVKTLREHRAAARELWEKRPTENDTYTSNDSANGAADCEAS